MTYRIATSNWELQPTLDYEAFEQHLRSVVKSASGADLLVLPECLISELAGQAPSANPAELVRHLASYASAYEASLLDLAREFGISIVGGSHFKELESGIQNVSAFATPDGRLTRHAKHKLTQYEADEWKLVPGTHLGLTADPCVGVLVCYDCEFPEAGRLLSEAGILILAVPAFTETIRGFQRVRWSCQARAIENQIVVVHSSLVGTLGGEPVPQAVGNSAILAPSIEPFPESAILTETSWGESGVAVAEVDLGLITQARSSGDVRNWADRANDWVLRK